MKLVATGLVGPVPELSIQDRLIWLELTAVAVRLLGAAGTASVVTMAVFVVLLNRFFWKKMYRLAEERYRLNA